MEDTPETRVEQALEGGLDEPELSEALLALAREYRDQRLRVRTCAWCGSICVDGRHWHRAAGSELVATLGRHYSVTHGICPSCLDEHVPGLEYPG